MALILPPPKPQNPSWTMSLIYHSHQELLSWLCNWNFLWFLLFCCFWPHSFSFSLPHLPQDGTWVGIFHNCFRCTNFKTIYKEINFWQWCDFWDEKDIGWAWRTMELELVGRRRADEATVEEWVVEVAQWFVRWSTHFMAVWMTWSCWKCLHEMRGTTEMELCLHSHHFHHQIYQ